MVCVYLELGASKFLSLLRMCLGKVVQPTELFLALVVGMPDQSRI